LGQSLGKALRGFKEGLNEKEKDAPTQDANARIESANPTETTRQTESTEKKS
jgi:Sec-independent protein translocase protein TatA